MSKRVGETDDEYRARARAKSREYYHKNREQRLQYAREQRLRYPEGKFSEYSRKSKFGITQAQFERMLKDQDNKCPICMTPIRQILGEEFRKSRAGLAVVDHCHETGRVRGLLCSNCNTGIGLLRDSAENMQRAYQYLKVRV